MNISFNVKKSYFMAVFVLVLVGLVYAVLPVASVGHPISQITVDADLDMDGNKLTNLSTPVDADDSATKDYVDSSTTMIQFITASYSSCTHRDTLCNLLFRAGNSESPQISKPAWAKNIHIKCFYGCKVADSTSTWRFVLGDTTLYSKSSACPEWADPAFPYVFSGGGGIDSATMESPPIIEKTADVSSIAAGSLLKAQAASDETNYIGYCTVTFTQ